MTSSKLLWIDFTFDFKGELFTASYKIALKRWEILSSVRFLRDPVIIPDDYVNANEGRALELISRL